MFKLNALKRDVKKSPDSIRKKGGIPAVFYGRKETSTPITVPAADFKKVWKEAGESSIITLSLGEEERELTALINDVALDPVRSTPIHADFYIIEADRPVEVSVPLEFIGESVAVKDLGGILVKVMHEIEVRGLPRDLPQHLTVPVSSLLTLESQILVKDISLPSGVTILSNPLDVVASITVFKEEEEEKLAEAFDATAIEVEKKGKKEEETIPEEEAEKA